MGAERRGKRARRALAAGLLAALLPPAFGAPAGAQAVSAASRQALFPPILILRHQREIGLREEQRRAIMRTLNATLVEVSQRKRAVQREELPLAHLVDGARVDENAALEQLERLVDTETAVKRAHLAMLIRIKNQLDPEQQRLLGELARAERSSR